MSTDQTLAALSAVPAFASLDESTLRELAQRATHRRYRGGQVIFSEGDPEAGLLLVLEGWLKASRFSPAGREQIVCVVGPGELCNEIGVFAGVPCPATIIALEPTTALVIDAAAVTDLVTRVPAMARAATQGLARRVLHMLTITSDLSLRTVEARLARLLLERAPEDTLHRYRWATQNEMAARLGTVPDVLNRELKKLADEGLIRVTRRRIEILDREALELRALAEE